MQIKILDTDELEELIAERVVKALKPFLTEGKSDDAIFDTVTIAEYLGVSDQWVRDRVKHKQIPYLKVGKFLKFRRKDIDRWLDTLKVPVVNPYSGKITRFK